MGSTFSSYEIARSGMYVSQRGLFVTGHNISNVNTPGFVRQQAMIADQTPMGFGKFQVGLGADIQQTRQIRDQFLDVMYRNESEQLGYWEAKNKMIEEIQTIIGEPSDLGLNKVIDQFFQGWHELSKDPGSLTTRALVRQRGIAFVETVNHIGTQLDKLQEDLNTEIGFKINEINAIAARIAKLNVDIMKNESAGDQANDLRDERNLLFDDLSKLINVDITEKPNGIANVAIGGIYLVNGGETAKIKADFNRPNSYFVTAYWEDTNQLVQVRNGMLKGLIDARGDVAGYKGSIENGSPDESGLGLADDASNNDAFKFDPSANHAPKGIIPNLRRGLNILVNLVARKINEIHSAGVGIDGSTGVDFFTRPDSTRPFEMGNITINDAFNGDDGLNKIAASATGILPGDNANAQKIVDFRSEAFFTAKNVKVGVDDFYNAIITWVGSTGQEAARVAENQHKLVAQIQNKKEAISGVSMDEEMTNMMKYQHAYNASARVINSIDEMIDQIINRMGIVGR
ncbi:MAG: flagellar hook-associated protein 1 [Clostridiales bacterium]|jgi:flagellar hook-associated protein 1 FlgK|nr:flagellar hook-associated protein 1 [Clostridiales bacterium]MDK2934103.1 flagellar hook-associated protein 1 [Clostridiales bacterium]